MIRLLPLLFILLPVLSSKAQTQFSERGKASYYADKFEHRKTASGERYSHQKLTAAHKTLPLGTKVVVTNLENERSVVVRINDRGPYIRGRIIDLSKSAMKRLNALHRGVIEVEIETLILRDTVLLSIKLESNLAPIPNRMNYPKQEIQSSSIFRPKKKAHPSFFRSLFK
jgi:rare lipoprotein A